MYVYMIIGTLISLIPPFHFYLSRLAFVSPKPTQLSSLFAVRGTGDAGCRNAGCRNGRREHAQAHPSSDYWEAKPSPSSLLLERNTVTADISVNLQHHHPQSPLQSLISVAANRHHGNRSPQPSKATVAAATLTIPHLQSPPQPPIVAAAIYTGSVTGPRYSCHLCHSPPLPPTLISVAADHHAADHRTAVHHAAVHHAAVHYRCRQSPPPSIAAKRNSCLRQSPPLPPSERMPINRATFINGLATVNRYHHSQPPTSKRSNFTTTVRRRLHGQTVAFPWISAATVPDLEANLIL